jgi:hypothetical protein
MVDTRNEYEGFGLDTEGWKESIPEVTFIARTEQVVIRDVKFDRMPRPVREFSVMLTRLDQLNISTVDGAEWNPKYYTNATLERLVKDQRAGGQERVAPTGKGKNKTYLIMSNWGKHLPAVRSFKIPVPVDEQGNFVPLPEETYTTPKGEEKTVNQVHIKDAEGVIVKVTFNRTLTIEGREAKNVALIQNVLPPTFVVPEDQVERVNITPKDEYGQGATATPGAFGGSEAAEPVDTEAMTEQVLDALVGKTEKDAVQALFQVEGSQVEPFLSGLSGEAPLLATWLTEGKLVKDKGGKLSRP